MPWPISVTAMFHHLGHPVQGQFADEGRLAGPGGLVGDPLEARLGVLGDIQEVGPAQVLVALGVVAVHAGGLDDHLDLGGRGVLLVVAEVAGEVVEAPVEPAIAQVLDAELDEGVGAFGVDDIVLGLGQPRGQQGTEEGGGQGQGPGPFWGKRWA